MYRLDTPYRGYKSATGAYKTATYAKLSAADMAEVLHSVLTFLLIFLVIFVLNVIPVFAPPTWTVLSFIAISLNSNILVLALVGAIAATIGRLVLAKLSTVILRGRLIGEGTRQNIDAVKTRLESNQKLTFGILLFYAFSPFPSNHLFIAYGLTALKLRLIAVPFLLGRIVSYAFWAYTASNVAQLLAYESLTTKSFFSYYFVASQLFGLLTIYVFTRIDWPRVFTEKRLRWRGRKRG